MSEDSNELQSRVRNFLDAIWEAYKPAIDRESNIVSISACGILNKLDHLNPKELAEILVAEFGEGADVVYIPLDKDKAINPLSFDFPEGEWSQLESSLIVPSQVARMLEVPHSPYSPKEGMRLTYMVEGIE